LNAVLLPLVLAATGIITSIIGTFLVKVKDGGDPHKALNLGEFVAAGLMLALTYLIITWMLPSSWSYGGTSYSSLVSGLAIGKITEYYTGTGTKPVQGIVDQSVTGAATNIIAGLGVGMMSTMCCYYWCTSFCWFIWYCHCSGRDVI